MTIKPADVDAAESHEAPQSALRRKVRDNMSRTTLATWDNSLRELAEGLRTDHDLDPFLRYYFLLRVLDFAKEGDSILATNSNPSSRIAGGRGQAFGAMDGSQRRRSTNRPQKRPARPAYGQGPEGARSTAPTNAATSSAINSSSRWPR